MIVGEASWPLEDREAAVRLGVDPHLRLDEVAPVSVLGDLQGPALVADHVVGPDDALLLDAQDLVESAHERHEGRALLGGRDREAGVVPRHLDCGEPPIGGFHRAQTFLAQERRKAALQRAEQPLHAAAPLRRVARDVLDPELRERPADLRQPLSTGAPAFGVRK